MLFYPEVPPLPNVKPALFAPEQTRLLTNPGGELSDVQASIYIEVGIQYPVQGIPLPIGGAGLLMPSVAVLLSLHHCSTSDDHSNTIIPMILFALFFVFVTFRLKCSISGAQ